MDEKLQIVCPHCNTTNSVIKTKLSNIPKCGKCKEKLFTSHPIELNSTNFEKHITENEIPVIVDFWASWCGPCRMMAPIFEKATKQFEPNIRFAKLNTETESEIAGRYNVSAIPTIIVFKDGHEISRNIGAMNLDSLVNWIKGYV